MSEVRQHPLRAFIEMALSAAINEESARKWSCLDEFGAYLGGENALGAVIDCDRCYMLLTEVWCDRVVFRAYGAESLVLIKTTGEAQKYAITGQGLFVTCLFGDARSEFAKKIELPGEYVDAVLGDSQVYDFSSSTVEIGKWIGSETDPLFVDISTSRLRMRGRSYVDCRVYGTVDDLINGVFGAWNVFVSSDEEDWDRFMGVAQPIFDRMC